MPDFKVDNERLNLAIRFAVDCHAGQVRKGTTIPYIVHPLEVLSILMRMNADNDLMIAGVLHDTVEDTDATIDQIAELFGNDVATLVAHHTEDKRKSWRERKEHAINALAEADHRVKMLVMADKLSNLRSIAADYNEIGDKLWKRFNAPRERQSWYYSEIQDALWDMQMDDDTAPAYWEMVGLYKDVFVRYYRTVPDYEAENTPLLLQICAHDEVHFLEKGCPRWISDDWSEINYLSAFTSISRKEAERTEDDWNKPFWARIDKDLNCSRKNILVENSEPLADITLWERKLTVSGQDIGPRCETINGKDEYEYYITFDEENTKRLLVQMRCEYGIEESFGELFSGKFPGETFSSSFMQYCDERAIHYTFNNF